MSTIDTVWPFDCPPNALQFQSWLSNMLHRLIREMMVLAHKDNHQATVNILPGRIIEVLGPAGDDRFSRVNVDGEEFERSEPT